MRFLVTIATIIGLCAPALAQDLPESIFRDYSHMRQVLDDNLKARKISATMLAFGASDEMTKEELDSLQGRVQRIYPKDFEHVDLLRSRDMRSGWRQELYAYWVDTYYLYAYLLMHDQGDKMVAVHFQFNSDFDELNANF